MRWLSSFDKRFNEPSRRPVGHSPREPRAGRPRIAGCPLLGIWQSLARRATVTISFVPDGTNLGGKASNLFSSFNARFGSASTWQNIILQAAQSWAQQTNINFAVVPDNGEAGLG